MKEISIIVAGFGGQGILFLGRLIAYGGMIEQKEVTCFPSYGAEMRGGTANCTVILSDSMIGSPIVRNPDMLIAMNEASLKRFQPGVRKDGLLLYDSSFIKSPELRTDIFSISIPASEIAASLSASRIKPANMVMFGAMIAHTGAISEENALIALERLTSQKRKDDIGLNRDAIRRGIMFIEDKKSKDS
ncbi:MAG: 2-oxoacid:acceptor oxidoreductase family protein [Nitrospirota bacterium]